MEGSQKPKKGSLFFSPFKRKRTLSRTPSQITSSQSSQESSTQSMESADTQRTRNRYNDSVKFLQDAIETCSDERWRSFHLSKFGGEMEDFRNSQLREQIDDTLEVLNASIEDQCILGKCRHILQCMFTALSPLAKNFLSVASTASNIPIPHPYGLLCSGLLLFITIAEREMARKKELNETLDFMCQQLEQLKIIDILPIDIDERESVVNRGLDIRSACMIYLGSHIRHDATSFGNVGKVIKTIIIGDENISDSKIYLQKAIENYSRALSTFNTGVNIKVLEVLKELTALVKSPNHHEQCPLEHKFIVPYQRNHHFIGRSKLLQQLREALFNVMPKKVNHRVALYGMGGVGKTQCAIEYVYASASEYERIYWIAAVDQASLLSGYQKIAKAATLPNLQHATPSEIAEAVIYWLKSKQNWLIVFDNLDDPSVINGLLPENGPKKHTLITTRNPHTHGIPAEPLQVPLLDMEESVDLLSTLSNISVSPNSEERNQAEAIIMELDYLPLAIEQAAAYVREVTGDFITFCNEYARNRRDLLQWTSEGNRMYSYSVATTWSMSFKIIQNSHLQAAELLQLLSFLNPDGVLIEFLESGADALENDLREIILDRCKRSKALLLLEKLSLIKWDRKFQMVLIHRLIQTVLKDEMSEMERATLQFTVVDLCDRTFHKNETLQIRRKYQNQISGCLLQIKMLPTRTFAGINERFGDFLRDEGKANDSERFLQQAVNVWNGIDHFRTLRAMNSLALTYKAQGRYVEAAKIHEEVLGKRWDLGKEHPFILSTMNNLAVIYQAQGRNTDAERIQEEVLEMRKRILGEEHPHTLLSMHNLATNYQAHGRNADAAKILEEVLEKRRRILGEEDPDTLGTMHVIALTYQAQGKHAEAAKIREEVLEKRRMILGEEHPHTLTAMHNLAWSYYSQGRNEDALKIQEEVLEKRKNILGEEHPHTLSTLHAIASTYQAQGRNSCAAKIQELVLEKRGRILGEEHPETLDTMHVLAWTYQAQGRYTDASKIQDEVLRKRRKILGEEHPHTLSTMHDLAMTYKAQEKYADATKMQEEVLAKRRRVLGEEHPSILHTMKSLAEIYQAQGRNVDAARIQEDVLKKTKRLLGEKHPKTLAAMHNLALKYQAEGRLEDARKIQEEVLEKRKRLLGEDHPETLVTIHALALTYEAQRNEDASRQNEMSVCWPKSVVNTSSKPSN